MLTNRGQVIVDVLRGLYFLDCVVFVLYFSIIPTRLLLRNILNIRLYRQRPLKIKVKTTSQTPSGYVLLPAVKALRRHSIYALLKLNGLRPSGPWPTYTKHKHCSSGELKRHFYFSREKIVMVQTLLRSIRIIIYIKI